jgi:hypothetical protein
VRDCFQWFCARLHVTKPLHPATTLASAILICVFFLETKGGQSNMSGGLGRGIEKAIERLHLTRSEKAEKKNAIFNASCCNEWRIIM